MSAPVPAHLAGWTPIHLRRWGDQIGIDWARLPLDPFPDPFFEQTVGRALCDPARMLFRRMTPLAVLEEFARGGPEVQPAGFIFHMSRCGSTLLGRMLGALPGSLVLSEASPLDQVVQLAVQAPVAGLTQRLAWMRGMVHALGQRRRGDERRLFIKFDGWHALALPFIREAFPEVPWVFLYRDPVEVLVSHRRRCGSQMVPGILDPRLFGIEPAAALAMRFDEYGARVLAQVCRAALRAQGELGGGRLVNFDELPAPGGEEVAEHFDLHLTDEERARMQAAAQCDAKNPTERHVDDREGKQREASPELRQLAREWLDGVYRELEAARVASGGRRLDLRMQAGLSPSG